MTSPGLTWPKSEFWTHSLDLYARPGVKAACLSLQERRGLDVNLVLWTFWLSKSGIALDRAGLAAAEEAVAEFRAKVVQALRAVRRHLRSMTQASSSIAADWTDEVQSLGDRVAQAELDGEHLCQLALERLSVGLDAGHPPGVALAAANLGAIAIFEEDDRSDLQTLFANAFPDLSPKALAEAMRGINPA